MNLNHIAIYIQDRTNRKYLAIDYLGFLSWKQAVVSYKIVNKIQLDILEENLNNHIITFFDNEGLIHDKEKLMKFFSL